MPELTPTEETILSLSGEGRSNAEIAVRLGLTVEQVRVRREQLRATAPAAVISRQSTGVGRARTAHRALPGRRPPRWLLIAVGTFAAAWLLAGLYLKFTEGSTTPEVQADPAMQSLGRVVLTPRGEAIGVDQRPALTVLTVPDGTVIRSFDTHAWGESFAPNSIDLYGNAGDAWVRLHFLADSGVSLIQLNNGGARVVRDRGHGGELHLFVEAHTNGGDSRTVAADAGGTLGVALESLSSSLVINSATGEILDVAQAIELGQLTGGWGSTRCALLQHCYADWVPQGGGLVSPFLANASCESDGSMRLDDLSSGYIVRVQRLSERCGSKQFNPADQLPMTMMTGSAVAKAGGIYFLSALEPHLEPVSLGIAADGTLYAGDIRPQVGCPCLPDATNGQQLFARR